MIHALVWLPLLALFLFLGWAGWNEYQKVQAYSTWAEGFQNAKYDILAVLARQEDRLVWGRPTRSGPVDLQEVSLKEVRSIQVANNGQVFDPELPPEKSKRVDLRLQLNSDRQISIPFTEANLAAKWCKLLQQVSLS
jgi:hypothetical protein